MSSSSGYEAVSQKPKPYHSVAKSAAFMSLATLCSRVLGMVRDMVMIALFPIFVYDAYVVAFRLPNLFRRVLGEGSLAASFVPLYIETLQKDAPEAKKFANAVLTMLCVLTATLSVIGIIFMPEIMSRWVSGEGYVQVEGKVDLTVLLARIMFSYLFLVMSYAFLMSLANAHKVFFLPALAPAGFNMAAIIFSLLPHSSVQGDQLAVGVLAGGFVQLVIVAAPLIKLKILPKLSFNWSVSKVPQFFKILLPSVLGMSITQLIGLLNVNFASRLSEGAHSYIYLADRLLELPQSLLSVSLGTALLPTLSEYWVQNKKKLFVTEVHRHVRLLSVLSLPAAVGLYVLAEPIIRVIYQRGHFGEAQVAATAQVLSIYALVLIVGGYHRVTVPAFYAIKNTWFPAANSAGCLIVHFFVADWATDTYGLQGLVAATAFTGLLNLIVLLIGFKLAFGELGVSPFVKSVLWLLPSLAAMGWAASSLYSFALPQFGALLALILTIFSAVVIYFGINRLLKHPEATLIFNLLIKRASRR